METAETNEAAEPRAPLGSPYVGLSYYTEDAAAIFFGRESERTLLIGNLRASRLTILYAQSGVGKSSLLRAGVAARVHELARRSLAERGSAGFVPVVFASWRDDPVSDLIDELELAIETFVSGQDARLPRTSLYDAITAAAHATDSTLVVLLDQFEEYFLYGATEKPAGRFADELAACISSPELSVNFLIAVREDSYAGVGDLFRGKLANPYANNFNLEHLDRDKARQAITRPIEHFNTGHPDDGSIRVEPGLIDAVLDQVRTGQVGFEHQARGAVQERGDGSASDRIETPYLQLVMSALWERERSTGSHELRLATLEDLGGAQAIVRSHLDRAMAELSEPERDTAVDVFHHLVTPSGTKIVHTLADLAQYGGRSLSEVQTLAEKLTSGQQRILRPVPAAPGDDRPRVEIYHDVLAPAILSWRATQTAQRLERDRQAAEARANRERRRARTFRALAAVSSILLVAAIVAVVLARVETNRAHTLARQALSRQLAAQAATDLKNGALARGVLFSIEAYRFAPTAEARSSLVSAQMATESMVALLGGHPAYVTSVAYSPDGRVIASGGADDTVLLQSTATGKTLLTLQGHTKPVRTVAYSPDGRLLVSGGDDHTLVEWNPASGQRLRVIRGQGGGVNQVAFSPNGRMLASANGDGTINLIDPGTGRLVRSLRVNRQAVNGVAFSPSGATLAAASSDSTVSIWSVATGSRIRTLKGHSASVNAVTFSPDGRTLASASDDHTVILWNAATGSRLRTLRGHTNYVNSVAFSHDGTILASAGADRNVILWDPRTGRRLQTLQGHAANVEDVVFAPSGYTLASGADDDQVIIWAARPPFFGRDFYVGSGADAVAYSRDGRLLAAGTGAGTIDLWDARTWRRIRTLGPAGSAIQSVAFTPDGRTIAAGTSGGSVILWNVGTGTRRRTYSGVSTSGPVYSVAYSPDGGTLAAGTSDDTVILWNARSGARERTLQGHTDFVFAVAFSPDSKLLASASNDKSVILWSVVSGQRLHTLLGHTAAVNAVAFSPDGATLASGGDDDNVILWNPSTGLARSDSLRATASVVSLAFSDDGRLLAAGGGAPGILVWDLRSGLATPLAGHSDTVEGLAFEPGSDVVASASLDGTVQISTPVPAEIGAGAVDARLCGIVRRNLQLSEWNEFVPGQPYHQTCPGT